MDRVRLRLLMDNVRTFLLSKKSREVVVFMFFLAMSAGFWLLQTLNESYETELRLPLHLTDLPEGVVITSEPPAEVSVMVRDRGTSLLGYYFGASSRAVDLSFASHDRGLSYAHVTITHGELLKHVAALLDPSTVVVSIRPDTVDYYFTRGVQKRVPVAFNGRVTTNTMYYLRAVTLQPDSVTVWGQQELLDSLESIPTVLTNLLDLETTTVRDVSLSVRRGTKVIPSSVTLTAELDIYTEKQVRVPIVGTNFPAGYSLRTFPSSALVSFRVGSKDYKDVTADNFVLTATYEELLNMQDSVLTLRLRSTPDAVSQVRIEPATVQYLIEQNETE